jgi:hypothetical protein
MRNTIHGSMMTYHLGYLNLTKVAGMLILCNEYLYSAQLHSLSLSASFSRSCHAAPGEHMVHGPFHLRKWLQKMPSE